MSINTLQQLVLGDRNTFVFFRADTHPLEESSLKKSKVIKFLANLNKLGYGIDNAYVLFNLNAKDFKQFKLEFKEVIESNTKSGLIFRTTFGESEELTGYTNDDWTAILAQYSITYGWQTGYQSLSGKSANKVLSEYVGNFSDEITDISKNDKIF